MGRESSGKKRKHYHHSRHEDSDSEDDTSSSSSDYSDSDSSDDSDSSETSSSEEERRKRRRKERKKARLSTEKKRRHSKTKKKLKRRMSKDKKAKKSHKTDFGEISIDDYFLKSAEFRMWLSKERGVYFSDLSSEESRKLFKKFASKWNSGSLDKAYYEGIQSSAVGHDAQSNYQWQFSSKVSASDLKSLREEVSTWSSSKDNFDFGSGSAGSSKGDRRHSSGSSHLSIGPLPTSKNSGGRVMGPSQGPSRDAREDVFEREERRDREKAYYKKERKDFRKRQEVALDEMLPKATGREARIEKKRVRAEQRRERELSPDLDNSKVYGTSSSSISDKVKARQEQREHRASAAAQKITDYQAREKAKVEAILQMAKANKKEGAMW